MTIPWKYNDGGRAATGIRGGRDDCVCRAVTIATGRPYREVFELIVGYALDERPTKRQRRPSDPLNGVHAPLVRRMLADLGWHWFPLMGIGTGTSTMFHLRRDELPGDTVIAKCSGHIVTVIDGVVQDTYDPSCRGSRIRLLNGFADEASVPSRLHSRLRTAALARNVIRRELDVNAAA